MVSVEKVKHTGIAYLPEEDYEKAVMQLRLQLNGVFQPFLMYGQKDYIPGAVGEIVKLAEDFSLRVRGVPKPISLDYIRRGRKG